MADYIRVGEPTNESEREGIRLLRDELLDHFTVIGNFDLQLPNRENTLEYDAVVVSEWGLYAVEIKGWGGEIRGDQRSWYLEWGRVDNPFIWNEHKARALHDFLGDELEECPDGLRCQSVVLLPREDAEIVEMEDDRDDRLLQPGELWDFFVERHTSKGPGILEDASMREAIRETILPLAEPGSTDPQVPNYAIDEKIERGERPYEEYIGRHEVLENRGKVRIKRYQMDPLMAPEEREAQYTRSVRDLEALGELAGNPYVVRSYDMFRDNEDELVFYLVSEWVGSTTLQDYIDARREGESVGHDPAELAAHMLRALAEIHSNGIVHRNLHPDVFYLAPDEDVPFQLADFDYARLAQLQSIAGGMTEVGTEGYVAPELWKGDEHDHRADIYSLGVLLFEIFTGDPLYQGLSEIMAYEETWDEHRARIEDDGIRGAMDRMLAGDPDGRCDDPEELVGVFESRT